MSWNEELLRMFNFFVSAVMCVLFQGVSPAYDISPTRLASSNDKGVLWQRHTMSGLQLGFEQSRAYDRG